MGLFLMFLASMPYLIHGGIIKHEWNDITILPPPLKHCCYGNKDHIDGQVVHTIPKVCLSLVCINGTIVDEYLGTTGQTGCCEFDGILYSDGALLPLQCLRLYCRNGLWQTDGTIESCCEHCHIFDASHIVTYDSYPYDWGGTCNYSITQTGFSYYPNTGFFSDFNPCYGGASCLARSTFRDNPNTIITLDGSIIEVNGEVLTLPAAEVTHITSSGVTHPVLAWKLAQCVVLVGSSKLMVQHCPHRLDIWAHPMHSGNLNGLCGHFNSYVTDDFTHRNSDVEPLKLFPLAFPTSWLTLDQTDGGCHRPCQKCALPDSKAEDPCKADPILMQTYFEKCKNGLSIVAVKNATLDNHIDSCAHDICLMHQNGESGVDVDYWILQLLEILQISLSIKEKRLGAESCNRVCIALYQPVCASGKTYSNACELGIAACKNPCIEFKHDGQCARECPLIFCTKELKEVCGTDGNTYSNLCLLEQAQCLDPCIKPAHDGPCGRAYFRSYRRNFLGNPEEVNSDDVPQTSSIVVVAACICIGENKPKLKQAMNDFDFLRWLMNDVYAKAALANTRLGGQRVIEVSEGAEGGQEKTSILPFWTRVKESVRGASDTIEAMQSVWISMKQAGEDDALSVLAPTNGTSEQRGGIDACPRHTLDATFTHLNDNFNDVIHLRADLDNGVLPLHLIKEILDTMPSVIASFIETEANFKDLVEKLNNSC